jgi:hypothetical protein
LMPLDELLECACIALSHQLHESHVFSILVRSSHGSSIVASHRSLRRLHQAEFAKKMASGEDSALCHIRRHGFCCKPEALCACLVGEGIALACG